MALVLSTEYLLRSPPGNLGNTTLPRRCYSLRPGTADFLVSGNKKGCKYVMHNEMQDSTKVLVIRQSELKLNLALLLHSQGNTSTMTEEMTLHVFHFQKTESCMRFRNMKPALPVLGRTWSNSVRAIIHKPHSEWR